MEGRTGAIEVCTPAEEGGRATHSSQPISLSYVACLRGEGLRKNFNFQFFGMLKAFKTPCLSYFYNLFWRELPLSCFIPYCLWNISYIPYVIYRGASGEQDKKKSLSSCSLYSSGGECAFPQVSKRPTWKKWGISNISVVLSNSQILIAVCVLMSLRSLSSDQTLFLSLIAACLSAYGASLNLIFFHTLQLRQTTSSPLFHLLSFSRPHSTPCPISRQALLILSPV